MPTVDYQVAASNDDADEYGDSTFNLTGTSVFSVENTNTASSIYRCAGVRFDGVAVPQGATIDVAYLEVYPANYDDPELTIYGNDVDDAVDFNTDQDIISRTRTTASASWSATDIGTGAWKQSPSIASVVKEIVDRGGWSSGQAMVFLLIAGTAGTAKWFNPRSWDQAGNALGAKLHIEYSVAGGVVPVMYYHYAHH